MIVYFGWQSFFGIVGQEINLKQQLSIEGSVKIKYCHSVSSFQSTSNLMDLFSAALYNKNIEQYVCIITF